jgi:hypothetical protein
MPGVEQCLQCGSAEFPSPGEDDFQAGQPPANRYRDLFVLRRVGRLRGAALAGGGAGWASA